MLHILRPIVRFALWVFFRNTDIRSRERVPRNRPLIFVANHPNVMLDGLLLATAVAGDVPRFLGKSTLFKNPLSALFLRSVGVIPVSRPQDSGSRMSRNEEMLLAASQVLASGLSLALFPEGISHPARQVRALKPGAARIALRVEDEAEIGVQILPVGLTYSAPDTFRSEVSIHFGDPIDVRDFLSAYRDNHRQGALELTALVHQRLVSLTWHVENPELETAIQDLAAIYTESLARDIPDTAALSSRLGADQELIQAVHHFSRTDPELVHSFAHRLRVHHRKLRRFSLDPRAVSTGMSARLRHFCLALLLAPLALYAFANNALPYFLPRLFVRPFRQTREMIGTIKLSVGSLTFPLWYTTVAIVVYLLVGKVPALLYCLTAPLSGFFALWYLERVLARIPLWQSMVLPRRRNHYLKRLTDERAALIRDLDEVKERYLASPTSATREV
jgi:glycerol-3-phosphate O-acyltransferase/dihydroxyacetone phosphate acyltransferase